MSVEPVGFREFVRANSRDLKRTAWLLTGDWTAAEDLVQLALEKTWPRWDSILHIDARQAYVRRVMFTSFLGWRRRRWTGEQPAANLPDHPTVVDDFATADLREALQRCLAKLPPRQRAVLVLRYFHDLTEADTAAALGCSVGT